MYYFICRIYYSVVLLLLSKKVRVRGTCELLLTYRFDKMAFLVRHMDLAGLFMN